MKTGDDKKQALKTTVGKAPEKGKWTQVQMDNKRIGACCEAIFDAAEVGEFTDAELMVSCKFVLETYQRLGCKNVLVVNTRKKKDPK